MIEAYGQVKITDCHGKPLPKVYVKTFCRTKIFDVKFYKDGYTDLRGRFDYASVNSPKGLKQIKRFAIFIMSDSLGSMVKEADVPSQVGKIRKGNILRSKNYQ